MKTNLILTLILTAFLLFFPFVVFAVNNSYSEDTSQSDSTETKLSEETETINDETVSVLSVSTGKVTEVSLFDYLVGTVSAEMPASYHEEALKAQTVACYTYLRWLKENSESDTSDITNSSNKHQAYLTYNELKEKWGKNYDIYLNKIKNVVSSVSNEFIEYKGETAMTVYHAISSGKTNSADEVWNSPVDYLVSVSAPGDKLSEKYKNTVKISTEDFLEKLSDLNINIKEEQITECFYCDETGYFTNLKYKEKTLYASDLRSAFSLDSLNYKIKTSDDEVVFIVFGKGHGVGMSQNSADYMARQGYTYREILEHFYKGTNISHK